MEAMTKHPLYHPTGWEEYAVVLDADNSEMVILAFWYTSTDTWRVHTGQPSHSGGLD